VSLVAAVSSAKHRSNAPGAPTLTIGTTSGTSVTFALTPPTTGGAIDAGGYQPQIGISTLSNSTFIPVITPGKGSFTASGQTFTISSGGVIAINATPDAVTSGVVEMTEVNGVVWQLNNLGNWYGQTAPVTAGAWGTPTTTSPFANITITGLTVSQAYKIQATAQNLAGTGPLSNQVTETTTAASTAFTISSGKIFRPDGVEFKAQGWSCLVENLNTMVTNSACQPLTNIAPYINVIGIANQTGPVDFSTMVTDIDQIVIWATARKILVFISSYTNAFFNGQGSLNSGQLTTDVAMFASLGARYASNPYVGYIIGPNEAVGFNASPQHWQYYQPLRAAAPNALIGMCISGGYTFNGMDDASGHYSSMKNVFWSFHPYAWEVGGQYGGTTESDVNGDHTFLTNIVAAGNWVQSLDGVIPCMAAEFGNANGNSPTTINGGTMFNVVSSYTPSICSGWIAWIWFWPGSNPFPPFGDDVVDPNNIGTLVAGYGDVLVANMKSAYAPA
jgi:hypothetical protein